MLEKLTPIINCCVQLQSRGEEDDDDYYFGEAVFNYWLTFS